MSIVFVLMAILNIVLSVPLNEVKFNDLETNDIENEIFSCKENMCNVMKKSVLSTNLESGESSRQDSTTSSGTFAKPIEEQAISPETKLTKPDSPQSRWNLPLPRYQEDFSEEETSNIRPYLKSLQAPEDYNPTHPVKDDFPTRYRPYMHPQYIQNLKSLPPVPTYADGLYPQRYYDNSNLHLLPANLERLRRSREDFLAELAHDAMLNNILPTMSFGRHAEARSSNPVPAMTVAMFPTGTSGGCAQPIFLDCSPRLAQGVMAGLQENPHNLELLPNRPAIKDLLYSPQPNHHHSYRHPNARFAYNEPSFKPRIKRS